MIFENVIIGEPFGNILNENETRVNFNVDGTPYIAYYENGDYLIKEFTKANRHKTVRGVKLRKILIAHIDPVIQEYLQKPSF